MKRHLIAAATLAGLLAGPGLARAQDTTSEKGQISYALGYSAGVEVERVIRAGEPLDMDTVMKAFQDAITDKDPAVDPAQLAIAMQALQGRMVAKQKAELERQAADGKARSEAFLAQNRGKPGVTVLPSGVQYRVLEAGNGARPTPESQVTLEFRSTLSDGTVIGDTNMASAGQPAGPATLRLSEIPLAGLREVLPLMPAGARWEVVMPASAAYGESVETAGDMAHQAVIFTVKLVSVGPAVAGAGG